MALVSCKECGEKVSLSAPTCPRCGVPYPGTSKGKLVIYRPEGFIGSIRHLYLFLDEKQVAALYPNEKFEIELSDGDYYLRGNLAGAKSKTYEITIQAGRTVKMKSWFESGLFGNKVGFSNF